MGKMKKGLLFILIIGCVALGFFIYKNKKIESLSEDELKIYGNIDIRQIQLAFFSEGRIKTLYVEEGQIVKKDQLLAEIDDSRYKARFEALKAKVKAQEQLVAKLHAGSRPQEIRVALARVNKAQAQLRDAQITYKRLKVLSKTKYVSAQKLDDAKARLDMAKAALDEAEEVYDLALIGPRLEDIRGAEETLNALRADLQLAKEKLKDTKLYSPTNGIIRNRVLEPGDMAFPNRPVFTLALTNPLWVRAYIPETELGKIAPGMFATVQVDSYPDEEFKGWVGYISPTAEFTPRNVETPDLRTRLVYQVRVYICNHDNKLRLGMPATVIIHTDKKKDAVSPSLICNDKK